MPINDTDILKYEKEFAKYIENAFGDNEQTIISDLFTDMSKDKVFPLTSIDVNAFANKFWNNYLSTNTKINPVSSSVINNCIIVEKRKYIAHLWIKRIAQANAQLKDDLFDVDETMSSYFTDTTPVIIGSKSWNPKITQYQGNIPNLTFILEFAEDTDNFFSSIRLTCIPHGQLKTLYGKASIISTKNTGVSSSVYFDFKQIINIDAKKSWRYRVLFSRLSKFNSPAEIEEVKQIEEKEKKYLNKYYHFMKYSEDEMLYGFRTKEKIKSDWIGYYGTNISDFAVGAERIVYALFNGKGIGQPNSCPVGADLFFEVEDAYIHIDLKTVQLDNIDDYNTNIFVGLNQNSYKGNMIVEPVKGGKQEIRKYQPSLPYYYCKGTNYEKICLSYFATILYDKKTLDIYIISLLCMPNGILEKVYGSMALQAGKNPDKTRYSFADTDRFISFNSDKRIKCIIRDDVKIKSTTSINSKLSYYLSLDV